MAQTCLLIVDSDPNALATLHRLFTSRGYAAHCVASCTEGLDVLKVTLIDMIIVDAHALGMSAPAFLEEARVKCPDTKRILISDKADLHLVVEAVNRGEIRRYVTKPWRDEDLLQIVQQLTESTNRAPMARGKSYLPAAANAASNPDIHPWRKAPDPLVTQLNDAVEELRHGFVETVNVFASLLEQRAETLAGHARRVSGHALKVAQLMQLDEQYAQEVMIAGLLHDIGKIVLDDELIHRPFHALPTHARGEAMKHSIRGQSILKGIRQFNGVSLMVRHHHECFDGSGWPDSRVGLTIPLGARILAVVNDFDCLQMGTLVNRRLSSGEAVDYLVRGRGRRYDPDVVDVYSKWLALAGDITSRPPQLRPGRLRTGMILAMDLRHKEGHLLLPKGQVLDADIIAQLRKVEVTEGCELFASVSSSVEAR